MTGESRPEHDPRRPTDPAMSMIMSREDFLDALIRDAKPDPEWPEVDLDEQAARFASVPQEERATWEPQPLEFLERVLKGLREL
ncbi:hypothetical protein [Actinokineospora enzanensis]|uniref:hypothetical protein n=1 Tax=Actinokineospora enzanensis TaxID=155975 RepID=UPI0003635C1A|nr:hypothetical protein [Actinokineospora enzanensis]